MPAPTDMWEQTGAPGHGPVQHKAAEAFPLSAPYTPNPRQRQILSTNAEEAQFLATALEQYTWTPG